MTTFLRLLADKDKEANLMASTTALRAGESDARVFQVEPGSFRAVPGAPFAYWVTQVFLQAFSEYSPIQSEQRAAAIGASTKDDGRFLRLNWEIDRDYGFYPSFAKGGHYSPFYADISLIIRWKRDGREAKTFVSDYRKSRGWSPHWKAELHNPHYYFRPGLTWPRRTNGLSFRVMPKGCIFADKGPAVFIDEDQPEALLALSAVVNSQAFGFLVSVQLARTELAQSFEVGLIQQTPVPNLGSDEQAKLSSFARRAWSLRRSLDTVEETSHAFVLPATLRTRIGDYNPHTIEMELVQIQSEIDAIVFDLYGFSEDDRATMQNGTVAGGEDEAKEDNDQSDDDSDDENGAAAIDDLAGLLSWAVGVVFSRFDWRLATAEREVPEDPEPFDPLPAKSPGMLPDSAEPFHAHSGILVDDEGHPHDLPNLLEEVLQRVDAPVQVDTRRWLQREFFPFHLQRYSKSRRKAPIYWPLSTLSGAYTLWLYYPDLTSQTLFTAVNDFIEPKLQQVRGDLDSLRGKGNARSKQEEKQLEVAADLSQELADLRDALLAIAPKYSPNHDDGVQITAAPLWQLFRHKPWQKVLNDTWEKLEQGDYDWAHLAMNYWPERVLRKCQQDRSLAIAHDVENTFWHEVEVPVMRGKKPTGETKLEWQPKALTDDELDALIQAKIKEKRA
ncbi:MAG: type II restriction endonuclease subunit M [Pseudomonadota bacterium]